MYILFPILDFILFLFISIPKIVLEETIRVLDEAGFEAKYDEGDIGREFWYKEESFYLSESLKPSRCIK